MIGVILGKAFDKALTIVVARWPVFALGWALFGILYLLGAPTGLVDGVALLWSPLIGDLVGRVLRPGYALNTRNVLRFWGVSVVIAVAALILPAVVLAIGLPNWLHARATGTESAAFDFTIAAFAMGVGIYMCWMGNRLSLAAPVAFFDGLTVQGSLAASWRLVTGEFWPQFGFNVLMIGAQLAIVFVPAFVVGLALGMTQSAALQQNPAIFSRYFPAAAMPLALYIQTASWCAYLLRLDWLKSKTAAYVPAAT
jgi:hypothetical protein